MPYESRGIFENYRRFAENDVNFWPQALNHLPIIACPKCLSFWCVTMYGICHGMPAILMLAISFLASYSAIWLELLEGYIDTLYLELYGKIIEPNPDNTASADAGSGHPESTMPGL